MPPSPPILHGHNSAATTDFPRPPSIHLSLQAVERFNTTGLAFIWSILRTKLCFRQKGIGKPPSSSQDDEPRTSKVRKDTNQSNHAEQAEISRLKSGSTSYTFIEQGKKISLDDIALSAYPFPSNIGATRSTDSLPNSHQTAHNLATGVDNASHSWPDLGLEHAYQSENSNNPNSINHVRTTATHLLQPTRDHPAWQETTPTHRRHTISTLNFEVMSPTGNGEMDSLRIPTRSTTPVFTPLANPSILPRMPESFAIRRYDERPRM